MPCLWSKSFPSHLNWSNMLSSPHKSWLYPHPHHLIIFDQQPRFVARLHFNRVQVEGAIHQLRLLQSQADAMRYHLNLRHHHHHHHRHHWLIVIFYHIYFIAYFPLHHLHHVQCWPAAHLHTFPGCTLGMGCICAFAHYEWAATAQLDRAANIISLYWHHHFSVCPPQYVQTHCSSLVVASYGKSYSVIPCSPPNEKPPVLIVILVSLHCVNYQLIDVSSIGQLL